MGRIAQRPSREIITELNSAAIATSVASAAHNSTNDPCSAPMIDAVATVISSPPPKANAVMQASQPRELTPGALARS